MKIIKLDSTIYLKNDEQFKKEEEEEKAFALKLHKLTMQDLYNYFHLARSKKIIILRTKLSNTMNRILFLFFFIYMI